MRYIYLILLALTFFTACKKEHSGQPVDDDINTATLARIRYYFTDRTYFDAIYNYDSEGLLSDVVFHDSVDGLSTVDHHYYTGTRLDSSLSVDGNDRPVNKNHYSYQNTLLTTVKHYELNETRDKMELYYTRYVTYSGTVLHSTSDVHTTTDHNTSTVYTYTNGNVSQIKVYRTSNEELLEHTVYEYDDKPNPHYNKPYTNRHNVVNNKNNVTLEKLVYGKNRQPAQVKYVYDYNSMGYPRVQYIQAAGNRLIPQQEFFYK